MASQPPMAERARIARYFTPLAQGEIGSFNLTDDAAVIIPPPGQSLVITTDSVIESIHVLPGATPTQFAQKLMRRNLSDLAAMGATPWRYTLNLHTPRGTPDAWFAEFSAALADEQQRFGLTVIGGDSTSAAAPAPIHTTMTCFGLLQGQPLRRNGAQAGDDLYVSGTIGDAALGLLLLQPSPQHILQHTDANTTLIDRYHRPQPRLALGEKLRGLATAAIDISDGLLADSAQLCAASQVGAIIHRDAVPRSAEVHHLLTTNPALWNVILNGGDDYELCFTAPVSAREKLQALAAELNLPLTRIGTITTEKDIRVMDDDGKLLRMECPGWEYK